MSTITREFTKEQLIEQARKNIEVLRGAAERIPGASDAAVIHLKLAEITLASLEADPVAWRSLYYENHGLLTGSKNVLASWQKQGWECEPLYIAPPVLDSSPKIAESPSGNSPVIPDGWVAVPVEPTEDMIVNGFESEPDESFSDEKEWEAYEAMSGCQQAAHRAKLCWAAMLSAAPKI
ncbi:hypothetical protein O8E95_001407 [Enterobacter quasiroggenkampii]